MKILISLLYFILVFPIYADGSSTEKVKLWEDGRITPEQPFKGEVVASGGRSPWAASTVVYLQGEEDNSLKYLEVIIGNYNAGKLSFGVNYKEITEEEFKAVVKSLQENKIYGATLYLDPVPVYSFAWVSPYGALGKVYGDQDLVKRYYSKGKE